MLLARKELIYLSLLATIICSVFLMGMDSGKIVNTEISRLTLPSGTISSGKEGEHFYFINRENQEIVVGSFDQEIRKNGWNFLRRADRDTAVSTHDSPEYRALYAKGDLILTFSWRDFTPIRIPKYSVAIQQN